MKILYNIKPKTFRVGGKVRFVKHGSFYSSGETDWSRAGGVKLELGQIYTVTEINAHTHLDRIMVNGYQFSVSIKHFELVN